MDEAFEHSPDVILKIVFEIFLHIFELCLHILQMCYLQKISSFFDFLMFKSLLFSARVCLQRYKIFSVKIQTRNCKMQMLIVEVSNAKKNLTFCQNSNLFDNIIWHRAWSTQSDTRGGFKPRDKSYQIKRKLTPRYTAPSQGSFEIL